MNENTSIVVWSTYEDASEGEAIDWLSWKKSHTNVSILLLLFELWNITAFSYLT